MSDTEKVVVEENVEVVEETAATAPEEKKKVGFKAGFKEWGRKKIVGLKRSPQNIALLFITVTSIYYLISLYTLSKGAYPISNLEYIGLFVFINTLLSILVFVSFLNAFPKRKKPVIPMIVLVFVMIAVMIVCDIMFYVKVSDLIAKATRPYSEKAIYTSLPLTMVHVILLAVCAVLFALTPVFGKLINKINTRVELESTSENMNGQIDIQED
jgi:magnesium-transporting ATPase (P-type)